MAMKSLHDLFVHFLRDVLYAEKQGLKTLRTMQRKAESDALKTFLDKHKDETETQIDRLTEALEALDLSGRGVRCEAMDGIIDETKELMEEAKDGPTRDAAIIAAAQAMKHYEITRYGTIIAWAKQLGHAKVVDLMGKSQKEDAEADKAMTTLAEKHLNAAADMIAA